MKGKKSMFFTILALLFVDIFLISYQARVDYDQTNKFYSMRSRIHLINDFIESLEQDAERGLYISGSRAMISLNNYVISEFRPLDDSGGVLKYYNETIISGTINGENNYTLLMDNNTLIDWANRMTVLANQIGLILNLEYSNLTINHSSPYNIRTSIYIKYILNDTKNTAYWNRSAKITTDISISGWQDPYYSLNTKGVMRQITPHNITIWNSSTTKYFINEDFYRASSKAPSFLLRLENRTQSSPHGIFTILNLSSLAFKDYNNTYNLSVIDFYYINQTNLSTAKIDGIDEEWFRLDEHFTNEFGLINSTNYTYPNYD
jgi:hypothetical protein